MILLRLINLVLDAFISSDLREKERLHKFCDIEIFRDLIILIDSELKKTHLIEIFDDQIVYFVSDFLNNFLLFFIVIIFFVNIFVFILVSVIELSQCKIEN